MSTEEQKISKEDINTVTSLDTKDINDNKNKNLNSINGSVKTNVPLTGSPRPRKKIKRNSLLLYKEHKAKDDKEDAPPAEDLNEQNVDDIFTHEEDNNPNKPVTHKSCKNCRQNDINLYNIGGNPDPQDPQVEDPKQVKIKFRNSSKSCAKYKEEGNNEVFNNIKSKFKRKSCAKTSRTRKVKFKRENFVQVIDVESYKQYNLENTCKDPYDNDGEDEEKADAKCTCLIC